MGECSCFHAGKPPRGAQPNMRFKLSARWRRFWWNAKWKSSFHLCGAGGPQLKRNPLDGRMTILGSFNQALVRARRRKTPWNLALIPLVFGGWLVLWWAFLRLAWRAHELLYPEHAGRLRDFWPAGVSAAPFVSSLLIVFGPMVPALVIGMLIANALLWLVRPARQALEAEARPHPGTDFRTAQRTLLRIAVWSLLLGSAVTFMGVATLQRLR